MRKLTEKSIVLEFGRQVSTDQAQFGFLAGVQVIQAALIVFAALETTAIYMIVV